MEEQSKFTTVAQMPIAEITTQDITQVTGKSHSWKAPDVDGLQSFWYKRFSFLHSVLAAQFTHIIHNPQDTPWFFTQGITYMKQKTSDT